MDPPSLPVFREGEIGVFIHWLLKVPVLEEVNDVAALSRRQDLPLLLAELLGAAPAGVRDHDADDFDQLAVPLWTRFGHSVVRAGVLVAVRDRQASIRCNPVVCGQVVADPFRVEDKGALVRVHSFKGNEGLHVAGRLVRVVPLGRPEEEDEPVKGVPQRLLGEGQPNSL